MLSILIATGMSARPGPLSGQNQKVCVCVCRPRHAYTFTTIFHFYIYLCKMKTMSSHQYFSFQSNSPFTPLRVWNLAPIIRIYLLFDRSAQGFPPIFTNSSPTSTALVQGFINFWLWYHSHLLPDISVDSIKLKSILSRTPEVMDLFENVNLNFSLLCFKSCSDFS